MGYTELAVMQLTEDHPSFRHLTEVAKASERAASLVAQILTFSRKEQKELVPTIIQPIIKEPLKLLRASLPTTIEIRQQIGKTGKVLADGNQLHQVMMNLCTNASHAMPDGGILDVQLQEVILDKRDVRPFPELEAGIYAKLSVSDNGCGMSKQVLAHIFDPYFTTKGKGKGTGLGLAVVQEIVKSFNGEITVQTQVGKGTLFTIFLPIVEDLPCTTEGNGHDNVFVVGGDERVLVVDDEDTLVRLLSMTLEDLGYRVSSFTSSVAALQAFRATPAEFDLIISDMTMPEMTGLQLAAEVRNLRPGTPFIICTGYSAGLTPVELAEAGVMTVLNKPVQRVELAQVIRTVLTD
jgi:CheY-like chemotaxis protein/anti-sigma regulatory factor (Ser/Thr protein kinase)